jgi:hypothetical protein
MEELALRGVWKGAEVRVGGFFLREVKVAYPQAEGMP